MSKRYTKEYYAWRNMCALALRRNLPIEPEWLTSYDAFFDDMGLAPSENHALIRAVPRVGFFKSNCNWQIDVRKIGR